jgi:hypothetical protein
VSFTALASGIHDLGASAYHADEITDVPTLSASIASILVGRSPAHARAAHPKLNPDLKRVLSEKFDLGTAAHRLFLEGTDAVAVVDAADWRTNAAKDARATARAAGRIPLLPPQAADVAAMVAATSEHLARKNVEPEPFTDGKPEQTLIWGDNQGVVCRARLDWLRDDFTAIDDYKTTSASADPEKWTRTMYGMGCDVQVAFYLRGVEKITGVRPVFRYVVQETYPPYELSVVDLAPSALALAEDKVERAIELWAVCLERGFWPGYSDQVASIEVPTFEEMRWLSRIGEEAAA